MINAVVIIVLFGLMQAFRSFDSGSEATSTGVSVALGYLLLTGYFAGKMFADIRLPKLTGYIVAGIVVGPAALGLVSSEMVESLKLVNGMAVALIALTAGTELELRSMRSLLRAIAWISTIGVIGTAILLSLAVFFARPWLPFLQQLNTSEAIAVASMLGIVMVAQSPAVVVTLKNELAAEGPVSRTVLGVVVIADLVVILLFALASSAAKAVFGEGADVWTTVRALGWELGGSLLIGAVIGILLSVYVQKIRDGASLFLMATTFIVAEVGTRLHLDPLLVALSAGILIRNATKAADAVHKTIEGASLPVYVLFFTVAGTTLHLDAIALVGIPASIFVLIRAAGLLSGTRLAAMLAGAPDNVRKYAGFGLLPQAGLALALSVLFSKTFPEFGADAGALTLSVIAINEIVAPATYRWALLKSGEATCDNLPHRYDH